MTREERLIEVGKLIDYNALNERGFDILYAKLLEEFNIEEEREPSLRLNPYLNNLRQTRDKQAHSYQVIKKRRQKKGAPNEYQDFIQNFRQDISEAKHL